ncbi:MAG: SpoIIE family protein phosphatase, partial [Bacteroidota bacterium]
IDTAPVVLGVVFWGLGYFQRAKPSAEQKTQEAVIVKEKSSITRFKRGIYVSLALLVLLIIVGQIFINHGITEQYNEAAQINMAGRQRMLSQRISKNLLLLQHQRNADSLSVIKADELRTQELLEQLTKAHKLLLGELKTPRGVVVIPSPNAKAQLIQVEKYLGVFTEFVQTSLSPDKRLDTQRLTTLEHAFLEQMELTVSAFQEHSERKVKQLETIGGLLTVFKVLLLLLVVIVVIYPAIKQMDRYVLELAASKKQEQAANEELRQAVEELSSTNETIRETQSNLGVRERLLRKAERITNTGSYQYSFSTKTSIYSSNFSNLFGLRKDKPMTTEILRATIGGRKLQEMETSIAEKVKNHEKSYSFIYKSWVNNESHTFKDIGTIIYDQVQNPLRILGVIQDITQEEKERLQKLQERQITEGLYTFITTLNPNLKEQIEEVLYFALKVLRLDLGIVSRIDRSTNTYEVLYVTPNAELEAGTVLNYDETFCFVTKTNESVLGVHDVGQSTYREYWHEVNAYIAVKLKVDGESFGTLNFSSQKAREKEFTTFEENFLMTVGQWMSSVLATQKHNASLEEARELTEVRSREIARKNKKIQDSIRYALRIQSGLLPRISEIKTVLPESFIFYRPKDIVSGDFYWGRRIRKKVFIIAADCTGHGVPGAMMTMMGVVLINEFVSMLRIHSPDLILYELHRGIQRLLGQNEDQSSQDGMDISICLWDQETQTLEFAGAKSPLVYVQDGKLSIIKGDSHSIGGRERKANQERIFTKHTVDVTKPTQVYLFSDGYQDQFGRKTTDGVPRKFTQRRLRELLLDIHQLPNETQRKIIEDEFDDWKGDAESQLDDVLVLGAKLG